MAETEFAEHIYGNVDATQCSNLDEDNVYANQQTITTETRDERKTEGGKFTGGDTTEVKYYRVAVVSLGLLCFLLLAVIMSVGITGTAERDQLRNEIQLQQLMYNNLTQEKDQLQALNTNLTQEKDQLQALNTNLTQEKDQLQANNTDLTQENNKLLGIIRWTCFGSSQYYISSEQKTWADSKQHCMNLGAHLVIIDSEEEQRLIYTQGKRAWIGLSDSETESIWKWVDGKVLGDSGYWMKGEPNDTNGEDCAEILPQKEPLASWNDESCRKEKNYICEKAK
ncbi:hypothetical protein ACEWY4_009212 [Coilia grayii]|uniref:C-type lectin domain-containing protein n=1 Tax=Coilia grayii TaxID=363190 RepID=A0ABD1K5T6_9TELE